MLAVYLGLGFVFISCYVLYRQLLPKPLPGIVYNASSAKSLWGDSPDLIRTVSVTGFGPWCAAQIAKAGAPLCQVFMRPFGRPSILVDDYREAHDILTRRTLPGRDADFDKTTFTTDCMGCLGHFHANFRASIHEDRLKWNRALLQDLMAPTFLYGAMGPAVHSKCMELVRLLEVKTSLASGRPFNAKTDLDYLALDVMLYFAFMEKFNDAALGPQMTLLSSLEVQDLTKGHIDEPVVFPEAQIGAFLKASRSIPMVVERYFAAVLPRLSLWWWKKQTWYKTIFSEKYQVLVEQLGKARKDYSDDEFRSAAEYMLMRAEREARKHGRNAELETDILVDELHGELVAGSHTTGGAFGWQIKSLTSHPHIQARLRKSLYASLPQAVADGRLPTAEELRRVRLPYLDAFIEETLRSNAVPVTREAVRDTTVLGHHIPKGYQVILVPNGPGSVSPWLPVSAPERSPAAREAKLNDCWDGKQDPQVFDPERWLVRTGDTEADIEFRGAAGPQLVFGHGVRGCWGKKLAQMELRTVVALLVWHFEFLEIPEALAGNDATEGIARRPNRVFVRLKKARPA
ncbi:cytochrome P450 [Nemania sp. FL0916]|nr:cytochrome P450 [Nemania sp. FL0916]